MSILDTILQKLGLEKTAAAPAAAAKPDMSSYQGAAAGTADAYAAQYKTQVKANTEIPMVDVVSKLDKLQASFNNKELTWKVSISDLLYILKMDNSNQALKDLATELGCPIELMGDSAKRNMWLHSTVLKKLAENGGNIPAELIKK
jgi:hypothetical protein